ncbi:hypothetical protein [Synechococcus sp. CBW1107]|uniref:hypothetical protein n=1 Tax=Synechococcus sp. CBW1107 TaxID=2789857 RepID=UPI002AD4453E|nr:hypothetical protein [Synechococcus sp. CBW1107]CAK6698990.1 hypothetical protein ICNINCKA_02550 [Synechococcus sp. CBW1107]
MDVSHQADLHVQRMSMWLLKAAWVVAIFRGALQTTKPEDDTALIFTVDFNALTTQKKKQKEQERRQRSHGGTF